MKLLCVSDEVDPVVYSPRIKERFGDVDAILAAGDLPMEYLSYIVTMLNKPLFSVFGNHNVSDLPYYRKKHLPRLRHEDRAWGGTYVGFQVRREAGLIVAGLGGSMRYNAGPNQFTQFGMWLRVLALLPALVFNRVFHGRFVDLVLTHAPPRGIHDREDLCHTGFSAFLWLMRAFKPVFLVHVHVHLWDASEERQSQYKATTVVNAYSHVVIDREPAHA
ncbi:MAG TPA: metallophosphoesterase [Spirochaetales bacterium]|nr:metallophosphoesterase [Spirochaetales bacterium]